MLHTQSVYNTEEKKRKLESLNPAKDCLIVSDLRSKFEWQNFFLSKYGVIEEEFIFRPSDLWNLLAKVLYPEYRWVSSDLMQSFLAEQLKEREEEFLRAPNAASTAFSYISQLSPLLQHPQGRDLLKDWFKENVEAFYRWGHWFFIAEDLWELCLEKKLLCRNWIPSFIYSGIEQIPKAWSRKLHLDLGLEIKYIEAEIFARLAKETEIDVNVLLPVMESSFQYQSEYESYRPLLSGEISKDSVQEIWKQDSNKSNSFSSEKLKSVKRYASSLSEIKDIVSSIRKLQESGVSFHEMAIVAADIGESWPVLRYYLDQEGIPCQRPYNTGAQSLKEIYHWIAELKLSSKQWTSADLEISLFSTEKKVLDSTQFRRLFSNIYGPEDLQRYEPVYQKYKNKTYKSSEKINRDQFLIWALSLWPSEKINSAFEQIVKSLLSETKGMSFVLSEWVQYLSKICSKIEVNIRPGSANALVCIDLSSSEYIPSDYVFFMGMSDSSFRRKSPLKAVSQRDILSLREATGFPFSPEEDRALEFYLEWFCKKNNLKALYFSFAVTDWSGGICAPSILWMNAKRSLGEVVNLVDVPASTRLDFIQQAERTSILQYTAMDPLSLEAVERDLGEKYIKSPNELKKFSPSSLKEFSICPFRFAARYKLKLSSLPELDLDIDRMKEGNIVHQLFELALQENISSSDQDKIESLVRKCIEKNKEEIGEARRWLSLEAKYIQLVKKFLDFEKEWKQEFPNTEYYKQEMQVDCSYDRATQKFIEKSQAPAFRAIVDRVDRSASSAAIIDYKMSKGNYKNFNSWLEDDDYQLLLYSKLVLDGMIEGLDEVSSAVYFSLKPWQRSTGFVCKEADPSFVPVQDKKRNKISSSELLTSIEIVNEKLEHFFDAVESGDLYPRPKKPEEVCTQCDWRSLCRAAHLNF